MCPMYGSLPAYLDTWMMMYMCNSHTFTHTTPTCTHYTPKAALGTLTEPTRWLGTDKWWSTTVDVTHLAAYLDAGAPTRLSLSNLLTNTYNVPLWAEATLQYYWQEEPSPTSIAAAANLAQGGGTSTQPTVAAKPDSTANQHPQNQPQSQQPSAAAAGGGADKGVETDSAAMPAAPAAAVAAGQAGEALPDEVVPLIRDEDAADSLVVLAGNGDG